MLKVLLIWLLSLWIAYGAYVLTSVDEEIVDYANERIDKITKDSPEKNEILRDKIEQVSTWNFSERIKAVFSKILERWNTPAIVDGMIILDDANPDRIKTCIEMWWKLSPSLDFWCMAPLDDFGSACNDSKDCKGYCNAIISFGEPIDQWSPATWVCSQYKDWGCSMRMIDWIPTEVPCA